MLVCMWLGGGEDWGFSERCSNLAVGGWVQCPIERVMGWPFSVGMPPHRFPKIRRTSRMMFSVQRCGHLMELVSLNALDRPMGYHGRLPFSKPEALRTLERSAR